MPNRCSYFCEEREPTPAVTIGLVVLGVALVSAAIIPVAIRISTSGQSNQWTGTFGLSSTCNSALCCCVTSNLLITRSQTSSGSLNVNISLAGHSCTTGNYSLSVPIPKSSTMVISPGGAPIVVSISSDGEKIETYSAQGIGCKIEFARQSSG